MDELISRQAAIDVILADKIDSNSLKTMVMLGIGNEALTLNSACDRHIQEIEKLQPERYWIPVTLQTMPKEDGIYLVTDISGHVVRYVFNSEGNSEEYWLRCAKAWMPLPEPYRSEKNEND